jgi:preprotein translocase subunit SecE
MFGKIKQFFTEVNKEMKKVSWPTQEQLRESTVVVIVTCLVIAAIVFVIDQGMTFAMQAVYGV